jgi:hypothetical protein
VDLHADTRHFMPQNRRSSGMRHGRPNDPKSGPGHRLLVNE